MPLLTSLPTLERFFIFPVGFMGIAVISANRTSSGQVVYLAAQPTEGAANPASTWTESLGEAVKFDEDAAREAALTWAKTQEAVVTDPFVVDVTLTGASIAATSAREVIRAEGPAAVLARLGYGAPR